MTNYLLEMKKLMKFTGENFTIYKHVKDSGEAEPLVDGYLSFEKAIEKIEEIGSELSENEFLEVGYEALNKSIWNAIDSEYGDDETPGTIIPIISVLVYENGEFKPAAAKSELRHCFRLF